MAKGTYTDNDRFVTAFRVFNGYNDKWVKAHEELGEILRKHDAPDSDWGEDGFQEGAA